MKLMDKLRLYVERHEKEEPTKITFIKKINALENEVESLKEIIVDDQYEIKRLKAQIKKLKESKAANNG